MNDEPLPPMTRKQKICVAVFLLAPPLCWALAGLAFAYGMGREGAGALAASIGIPACASIFFDVDVIEQHAKGHVHSL